jgi:hypothetical protein
MLNLRRILNIISGLRLFFHSLFYRFVPVNFLHRRSIVRFCSFKKFKRISGTFKGKKIIFAPINSFADRVNVYEALFARVFSEQGASVSFITCNQGLPMCSWNRNANNSETMDLINSNDEKFLTRSKCSLCKSKFERFYGVNDSINLLHLSAYANVKDNDYIRKTVSQINLSADKYFYKGVNVLEHSRASAIRNLLIGELDLDEEAHKTLLLKYLHSAVKYVDVLTLILEKERPDVVCCIHGLYLEHGVLVDLCSHLNIRIVISGTPFKKNCLWFSVGDTYHREIAYDKDFSWADRSLSENENKRLLDYVQSKQTGGLDNVSYHPNPNISEVSIRSELGLKQNDKLISVFTNTIWDSQIIYKENAFKNHKEWLISTIKTAQSIPEYKFVIRVHPAEVKSGLHTNNSVTDQIFTHFNILPDNVILVPPESDISSIDLGVMSEASIIYASKIGIELAVKGQLVIVAGEAICRNKNFTIDVKDPSHFSSILKNIDYHIQKFDPQKSISLAIKWSYHLFYEIMIPLQWATSNIRKGEDAFVYMPVSNSDYAYIQNICQQILEADKIRVPRT